MFKIQVRWANGSVSEFNINRKLVTLGRAPESDVFLPSEQASRHHASIYRKGGEIFIEDNLSANGTFVRNQEIRLPTPVEPQDPIKLGDVYIRVSFIEEVPEVAPATAGEYSLAQRLGDKKETVQIGPDFGADLRKQFAGLKDLDLGEKKK